MPIAPLRRAVGTAVAVLVLTMTACDAGGPEPGASPTASAATTTTAPAPTTPADPTATWTSYTDALDHFSLRYPSAWQRRSCAIDVHTGLFLGPNAESVAICNSGFVGQMSVVAVAGDERAAMRLSGQPDLVTADVTVGGHPGTRQTATAEASDTGLGPAAGTRLVVYVVVNSGRTYRLSYAQAPSGPTSTNVLADFDLMVTNTFTLT